MNRLSSMMLVLGTTNAGKQQELATLLEQASIGGRWVGPEESERLMHQTFDIFEAYGYLLKE